MDIARTIRFGGHTWTVPIGFWVSFSVEDGYVTMHTHPYPPLALESQ